MELEFMVEMEPVELNRHRAGRVVYRSKWMTWLLT